MSREIVLDTETTGFDPETGDRVVEIGALEIINLVPSGESFHVYLNPERDMPESAFAVHGLSDEFLSDKPLFAAVAQDFLDFIGGDTLVIHNAQFDVKFLNAELAKVSLPPIGYDRVVDTLDVARRKYPGQQNSLDALCKRLGVDNSGRDLHGALLDAELLAGVYLELKGGRQSGLALDASADPSPSLNNTIDAPASPPSRDVRPPRDHAPTAEEKAAHDAFVKTLKDPLWL